MVQNRNFPQMPIVSRVVKDPFSRIQWTPDGKSLIYAGERNGARAIMKQGLNGDLSEETLDFGKDELFDFGYSPDGRSLAVTRGGWQHDIVLIQDLK